MVLSLPSLQLNKSWSPIKVITVRKALEMLFEGRAKAVDADYSVYDFESWAELKAKEGEPCVHTAHTTIRIPDVIVLMGYDKIPQRSISFSRANLYRRDKWTCQYCGKKPKREDLTIEHIVPKSKGGKSTWENCVLACLDCNARKANHLLHEVGMKLLSKPAKPKWSPKLVISKVKNTPENWKKFMDDAYWNTELDE